MFRKFAVILLVGCCATQFASSKKTAPLDPLIDVAKEALQFVAKFIDFAFEESEATLQTIIGKLDYLRETALAIAARQVQRESDLLYKLIEAVKNRSSNANMDILNCLETVEVEAGNIQERAVNSSMSCIDASIAVTGENVLIILEELRQINVNFTEHEAKVDSCKGKLFPFECIKSVVIDLEQIALSIPAKIKTDSNRAVMDFLALGFEIFQCGRDATEAMEEQNVQIFNDFSTCVQNKNEPVTSTTASTV
ncbi:hypothetical protein HUJ04_004877 [Dendroctonus ponderosae]